MAGKVNAIPEGFGTVTPHIIARNAVEALEFYKKAFGAEEVMRIPGPDGKSVMHCEFQIGNSRIMMCDEFPDMGANSPQAIGGTPVTIHLYVEDADAVYNRAVNAGATATMPLTDMFWGDRYGKLVDPYGHQWSVATHVEDVSPEDMAQRMSESMGECGG